MTADPPAAGLVLHSRITSAGKLELSLAEVAIPPLAPDEVLIRVGAAPLNPSDLGLLLGPADIGTLRFEGDKVVADVPPAGMPAMAARLDQAMPVGNEGAGLVVAAGAEAQALLGKTVAVIGGAMYAQYRTAKAAACSALPAGRTAAEGASSFVNPMTALGMVETMRREGHTALVHTAAASNLGQMLNRICQADGIGLVNIVRSPAQTAVLRAAGAEHVCDSSAPDFPAALADAIAATGATLAFDAIGGGRMAGQILAAMEAALLRRATGYLRYGSPTLKQVYTYGSLDTQPTVIERRMGSAWTVGGWMLTWFLQKIGLEAVQRLRQRVMDELTTTFASHYTAEISLGEALRPETIVAYNRRATGEKFLIVPSKA